MFYELPTLMSANLSDRRRDGKGNGKWNVTPANFSLSLSSTDTPRILPREGGQHRSVCTSVYKFDNSFYLGKLPKLAAGCSDMDLDDEEYS